MSDTKISGLTGATLPLDGTEVLPIVQSGTTKKVSNNDLRPKQIQSNATSGVIQIVGPEATTTRVITVPNADSTMARTDAAQTFTGQQTFNGGGSVGSTIGIIGLSGGGAIDNGRISVQETAAVANSATTILSVTNTSNLVTVCGQGAGAIFMDLLLVAYTSDAVAVVASLTQQGGPAARTYTLSSGQLKLTMGSATTMTVRALNIYMGN